MCQAASQIPKRRASAEPRDCRRNWLSLIAAPEFAGQNGGIKQVDDRIWLVSFMQYDLGFFDHETCRLEPVDNPFRAKVLPMFPA